MKYAKPRIERQSLVAQMAVKFSLCLKCAE